MAGEKFLMVVYGQDAPSRKSAIAHNGAGSDHEARNFIRLLQAAIVLKRTLVVDNLPLTTYHNLGYPVEQDPRVYYDLDNCSYDYPSKGAGRSADNKIPYVMREDFPIEQFSSQDTLLIEYAKGERIETPKHDHWPLIVVRIEQAGGHPRIIPSSLNRPDIRLRHSQQVGQLAQQTVRQVLQSKQHGSETDRTPPRPINLASSARYPYVCVHARRRDLMRYRPSIWLTTTPSSIIGNLKARKDITPDTPIYLMTDERRKIRRYRRKLKKHFPNLYTYHDFEHLRPLGTEPPEDNGSFNNYLLYAVECLIRGHAYIQFVTHPPVRHEIQLRDCSHQIQLRDCNKVRIPRPRWLVQPIWSAFRERIQDWVYRHLE